MDESKLMKVIEFIERRLWKPQNGLSPETTIRDDLGVSGAEAADFMQDFGDEFGVDLSEFEFDLYFEREANALLLPFSIIQALFRPSQRNERRASTVPITVRDLVRSAEAGKWITPAHNSTG
jgi:acyl carrier protein